jgi:RimJ/RimL family protein N-acetyltransferase
VQSRSAERLIRDEPLLNLRGEKVALGPLRRELIPAYNRWINEFEGAFTLCGQLDPVTLDQRTDFYERSCRQPEPWTFTIYELATLRPVGMTWLFLLERTARAGFVGIDIGEKADRGRGYGSEALALVMDYGFHALGLRSLELTVVASNLRGVRAYQRAGFRIIGRRREAVYVGSRRDDFLYMQCLASEFCSPALAQIVDA